MSDLLARNIWVIQQKKEWTEILTGFETRNRYEILSDKAEGIGFVAEEGEGFLKWITRVFLRGHRPFVIAILDASKNVVLRVRRPWFWIWSSTFVEDAAGKPLGAIHRKFRLFGRRFEVHDAAGQLTGRVDAGFFRIWTFDLMDAMGAKTGTITKKWGGLLKEAFTDSDRFVVALEGPAAPQNADAKAVLLGAALALDFDYFEDNNRR
ncbi:MAG: phospholipid scramblase-related protein [Elusimicrobiota bacterium]|jgi:hypothetical protein